MNHPRRRVLHCRKRSVPNFALMRRPEEPSKKTSQRSLSFMRFSGMAFSMAAAIGLCTWLGVWLDGRMETESHIWTIIGALFGTLVAMYQVITSLRT